MTSKLKHTEAFKAEAVKLVEASGNISETARNIAVPMQTLHNWVKQSKRGTLKQSASFNPEMAKLLGRIKYLSKLYELQKWSVKY